MLGIFFVFGPSRKGSRNLFFPLMTVPLRGGEGGKASIALPIKKIFFFVASPSFHLECYFLCVSPNNLVLPTLHFEAIYLTILRLELVIARWKCLNYT